MDKNTIHNISNYLHQIISNAEYIAKNSELFEYAQKIQDSAQRTDALITDFAAIKNGIDISKNNLDMFNLEQFAGLNILIVDDVTENIEIMKNIFETLSCNICSSMSGEKALELIKGGYKPDIISMDVVMPGMDGVQTIKEIRLAGCDAYCIAVSALRNQKNDVVQLFDIWIPKPFTIEQILGALSAYKSINKNKSVGDVALFELDYSNDIKEKLLHFAKNGAYSDLEKLIISFPESKSKEFLNRALKNIDFKLIINSIVSP